MLPRNKTTTLARFVIILCFIIGMFGVTPAKAIGVNNSSFPTSDYSNNPNDQPSQNYLATSSSYHYIGNAGDTWRVSVTSHGNQSDFDSYYPSISADGRFVAFSSYARNLFDGDVSGATDILVHDNQTGKTELVSVHSDGTQFQNNSYNPSISADGRYVAFTSFELHGTSAVFLHDRQSGNTEALPFATSSVSPSISVDGQYIAYVDFGAFGLDDTNQSGDVFLYDALTTNLTRVSVSSSGEGANGGAWFPSISANGRYIAFYSSASNLVAGDTNGVEDVFVRDIQTGLTKRVSVNSNGLQGNRLSSAPSISADGRYVAFHSSATNLVDNDTNTMEDVFVHDMQTGITARVSTSSTGTEGNNPSRLPKISGDGRYIAFTSFASNIVTGDVNGKIDIYVHDRQTGLTQLASVSSKGVVGNNGSPANDGGAIGGFAISADGNFIAFSSDANNLVNGDTNGYSDIFVHENSSPSISQTSKTFIKSEALTPTSLIIQSGTTDGSISSLSMFDQTLVDDDPSAYVSFQTPQGAYVGYLSFLLPENTDGRMVSTMLLQVNFKVPSSSNQVWTWSIYDPTSNMWINLGSSTSADPDPDVWHSLVFRIRQPWKFVSSTNEIRIQLRSNNTNGDLLIDYEALHITYLSTPNMPVAPPVNTRRPGGF